MPRPYTVEWENLTFTSAGGVWDVFEVIPARDKPIELLSVELGSQEIKDAEEEQVRLRLILGHTTPGGTPLATPTPRPLSPHDAACGMTTVEVGNDTIASGGTAVNLWSNTWNLRAGGPIWPPLPQGSGFWVPPAATAVSLVLRMMGGGGSDALLDDVKLSGTALIVEYP